MKHEPVPSPHDMPAFEDETVRNAAIEALLASMSPCPSIPSTPAEVAASEARAEADVEAGQAYDSATVRVWLDAWQDDGIRFGDWIALRDV